MRRFTVQATNWCFFGISPLILRLLLLFSHSQVPRGSTLAYVVHALNFTLEAVFWVLNSFFLVFLLKKGSSKSGAGCTIPFRSPTPNYIYHLTIVCEIFEVHNFHFLLLSEK